MDAGGARADSVVMSRRELEDMIVWETNNLYEYLKGLYDQDHANMADFHGWASAQVSPGSPLGATGIEVVEEAGQAATPEGPEELGAGPPVCLAEAAQWCTDEHVRLAGFSMRGLVVTVAVIDKLRCHGKA